MEKTEMWLKKFTTESNRIEGITRATPAENLAHHDFLSLESPTIAGLEALVSVCAPGHRLRDKPGLNVRVGNHIAPSGGPEIRPALEAILAEAKTGDPHDIHVRYEMLHPFTDGNGRSGRALWLWMMRHRGGRDALMAAQLGFLHSFYYQTLSRARDDA